MTLTLLPLLQAYTAETNKNSQFTIHNSDLISQFSLFSNMFSLYLSLSSQIASHSSQTCSHSLSLLKSPPRRRRPLSPRRHPHPPPSPTIWFASVHHPQDLRKKMKWVLFIIPKAHPCCRLVCKSSSTSSSSDSRRWSRICVAAATFSHAAVDMMKPSICNLFDFFIKFVRFLPVWC